MSDLFDTTLYTHKRLNTFVQNYSNYIENVINSAGGDSYQYYNFQYSPNGITIVDTGRIPNQELYPLNPWIANPTGNSTNGWKMELGISYNKYKYQENQQIGLASSGGNVLYPVQPGLQFVVILLPDSAYSSNYNTFQYNAGLPGSFIDYFADPSSGTIISQGLTSAMDTYADAFLDASNQISNLVIQKNGTAFGCEWFGYFKPNSLGNYVFNISAGTGVYYYIWIGDKAICEYTPKNADVYNNNQSFTINVAQNTTYCPIRIQYYGYIPIQTVTPSTPTFSLTIQTNSVAGQRGAVTVPVAECMYTIGNGTYGAFAIQSYVPTLMYCAFVSGSVQDLQNGNFICYQLLLGTSQPDLVAFYQVLNTYKYGMQSGVYDNDNSGLIVSFGELPDNTYYTPISGTGSTPSLPDRFSVYRLTTDLRMGNSFQIATQKDSNGLYPMQLLDPSGTFLSYADNYNEFIQYYPTVSATTGQVESAAQMSGDQCEESCNNSQNCNYYFTYTANGVDQCVTDNLNSIPDFNQVIPTGSTAIDAGSSSLFMRNLQFTQPAECSPNQTIEVKTLDGTANYSTSFKYANYNWQNPNVSTLNNIGICGDPKYIQLGNDAAQILYQDATYFHNGAWIPGQAPNARENMSTMATLNEPGQDKGPGQTIPGQTIKSKYTDAIGDTADGIRAGLANEQKYAVLMKRVNNNYVDLSQNLIPDYLKLRAEMAENVNYDFKGDELLYFRNKPIPTLQQQSAMDTNQEYITQNLLYILGTLTVVILLVLALILGSGE